MGRCLRNNGNCNNVVIRKRCVCWYEAIPVRRKRRCCQNQIEGMSLQLANEDEQHLPSGCPIVFDQILTKNSCSMCCHKCDGTIEVHACGSYLVDWDVSVEHSEATGVSFSLEVNGEIEDTSVLPTKSGQLSGRALIQINQIPSTVRLLNTTAADVKLSACSPTAKLRIVTLGIDN